MEDPRIFEGCGCAATGSINRRARLLRRTAELGLPAMRRQSIPWAAWCQSLMPFGRTRRRVIHGAHATATDVRIDAPLTLGGDR